MTTKSMESAQEIYFNRYLQSSIKLRFGVCVLVYLCFANHIYFLL